MDTRFIFLTGMACLLASVGCGASSSAVSSVGGTATVKIEEKSFDVNKVKLKYEFGEGGYFRIEGDDASHQDQDCLPNLGGGLALYGDMPAGVASLADLAGKELPFEFTGDGDDFNLCFVGSNGLLGVTSGTVRFAAVNGHKLSFSFSGTFDVFDGEGGRSPSVSASGSGVAEADN